MLPGIAVAARRTAALAAVHAAALVAVNGGGAAWLTGAGARAAAWGGGEDFGLERPVCRVLHGRLDLYTGEGPRSLVV